MGFVVKKPETIDLGIDVELPDGSKQSFSVKAKYLTMRERKDLVQEISENNMEDAEVLNRLIVGWHGVREEDGTDTEYNADNLARLIDIPCCYEAVMNTIVAEYLNPIPARLQPFARKN